MQRQNKLAPNDITLKYDETGDVSVEVTGGTGPYTIKWEQNSELWAPDYWQFYANTNTITVTNPGNSPKDRVENKFRCTVTDANGQTKSFEVTVVYKMN